MNCRPEGEVDRVVDNLRATNEAVSMKSATESASEQPFDVVSLMRERLPQYIMNCFLAAGFDVQEIISSMDVSHNPGNLITQIESVIKKKDTRMTLVILSLVTHLVSYLGHRMQNINFVQEVKKRSEGCAVIYNCSRKRKRLVDRKAKKQKLSSMFQTKKSIRVKVASTHKQCGSNDCAGAYATSIAFGQHTCTVSKSLNDGNTVNQSTSMLSHY